MPRVRPDPSSVRSPERRLVPDLSDTIEAGGQRLTRVARVAIDPEPQAPADPEPTKTLDSIARKHLGASVEELIETLTHEEPPPEPSSGPPLAARMELFGDLEAVAPDPETNPTKRAEGAVSPIILTDDAPDNWPKFSKPETLIDLFNMFPMIDGVSWFIHVKRKSPTQAYGMKITGPQRAITRPLSYTDWENIYGGGTFELIVYGPPKNGNVLDHQGRIASRRLTDPFLFDFPGPPNTEGLVHAGGEELMNPTSLIEGQLPRRPQTIAEGKVEEARIEVGAAREIRAETREERDRAKIERQQQQQLDSSAAMMKTFMEMQDKAAARETALRSEQIEREREHARELRELAESMDEKIKSLIPEKKPDDVERLIKLTGAMNQSGSADEIRAEHAREVQRLTEQRARDQDSFNLQLKDARERSDRLVQDERQRADQRIKDAEERFHNKERDERERAASEIQKIKDEVERRLADQHRQMTDRIADLDRNHARDLASKEAAHAMQLKTTESTYEMRLDQAKGEVKRVGVDVERYRREADENKDFVGKISKFREQAAELGLVDASEAGGSEPETFPQMLMKVGTNLAGALPSIVENIGNMMKGKDEQALAQARLQGRQEMVAQAGQMQAPALPPAHQRRGVPRLAPFQPISQASPLPLIPGHEPGRHNPASQQIRPIPTGDAQPEEIMRQEALARQQQMDQQQALFAQAQAPVVPGTGVDPFHTGMPPEPQMVAPQQYAEPLAPAAPPSQAPPPSMFPPAIAGPAPIDAAVRAEDQQIVSSMEGFVLPSYENQHPAELLAAEFAKRFPKEQIQAILAELGSADRLIDAFEREKGPSHPFARRDGKKYLRALFTGLVKAVS